MVENIYSGEQLIAIIVSHNYDNDGISFFTPDDFSQQLAYIKHPKGKIIDPHVHNIVAREISYTKEVLFIKKGKVRVDFYNDNKEYLKSRIISDGDVILLAKGGHGFEILEDTVMFEVKQGPYIGEQDKVRFQYDKNKIREKDE